jgi:uncharacterized protein (DUF983 family)
MESAWSTLKRLLGCGRGLQRGSRVSIWRQMTVTRRLTILFWVYLVQAVAGSVIGFTAPFLYYFGFL